MPADEIAPDEADAARARVAARLSAAGGPATGDVVELGAMIVCAYPALAGAIDAHPEDLVAISRGLRQARDLREYRRLASIAVSDMTSAAVVRHGLRRLAAREKLRIAARELLADMGDDVDVPARELSDLAEVCCEVALAEALSWAEFRFGTPFAAGGERC